MNNLTSTLLTNHSHFQVEEWLKQGQALEFNSGKNQRIVNSSIPAIELQISYKNLNFTQFNALKEAYESNHANTVIIDVDQIHDLRPDVMGLNSSVWAFQEFKFNVKAPKIYNGSIKLISSVFFNYSEYQTLFSQSSSYTPVTTTDDSFETVLNSATPYQVDYEYISNSIFSNIGNSARHIKDKGGLRKKWTLSWLLQETNFLELLKYYRKKAGIMGVFGIPEEGSTGINIEKYLENADDYVEIDDDEFIADSYWADSFIESGATYAGKYFENEDEYLTKAMFMKDSFQYSRRVDNIYVCKADIVEVLN